MPAQENDDFGNFEENPEPAQAVVATEAPQNDDDEDDFGNFEEGEEQTIKPQVVQNQEQQPEDDDDDFGDFEDE